MRTYTEPEICLMLLCALPGESEALTESRYRKLMRGAAVLGAENTNMDGELDMGELKHLGCTEEEAAIILERMDRRKELENYIKNLARRRISVITRISPEYPRRLRDALGDHAPLVLYCLGDLSLFQRDCLSLVGSRKLRDPGKAFAQRAGQAMAEQGFGYCSGGAAGADTEGFWGADRAGGCSVLFLADSLLRNRFDRRYLRGLEQGRLLLATEYGPDQPFSSFRALSRNRLIHAMGQKVLVAQTDYGAGGTWNGCLENLKAGWSPVFMFGGEGEDPGTRGLLERGASPVGMEELGDLSSLVPSQTRLFP